VKRPEFPQRMCKDAVAGSYQNYYCEVADLHPGPCASFSVKESVERRDAWEAEHPGWEQKIGSLDIMVDSGHEAPPS
jgi:hypothetical protein